MISLIAYDEMFIEARHGVRFARPRISFSVSLKSDVITIYRRYGMVLPKSHNPISQCLCLSFIAALLQGQSPHMMLRSH